MSNNKPFFVNTFISNNMDKFFRLANYQIFIHLQPTTTKLHNKFSATHFTSRSWVTWLIIIFGTNLACTDCRPFNNEDGFKGSLVAVIFILMIISFLFTFIFEIPYGCCDIPSSLFEATPPGMVLQCAEF